MSETRTEWAVRVTYHDGTAIHEQQSGREYAESLADRVASRLVSPNDPTRLPGDIKSVAVVSRAVTVEADGTEIRRPWHVERAGVEWATAEVEGDE